jgi:decaprenylphospho-beta-D-ribofuranose 2-oxidase
MLGYFICLDYLLQMKKIKTIANWGNFPKMEAQEIDTKHIVKLLNDETATGSFIARGNGRCYGDAALNETVVSTLDLKYFIDFDVEKGEMECQSGVLFSDLLDFLVPRGFFLPVTPGTQFITLGGAIAADVHGKNHHVDGCFSEFVLDFQLLTSSGTIIRCSENENAKAYWQTIGGMGLTGVILSARFRLKKIENSYIYQESIKAKNLDEVFALFEDSKDWTYTVAWIDCLQKGKQLGRSVLMRGEHATNDQLSKKQMEQQHQIPKKGKLNIPLNFPGFVLNSLIVKAFNLIYYYKQWSKKKDFTSHYATFFYPLDAILNWNKIYGKKGFIQYQFVIPKETSKEGMREVLTAIAESGQGSFLAVLKLFGKKNEKAFNSFPIEGYTLALDFKVNKKLALLVPILDKIVLQHGGRIYRAKDSMSRPELTNYLTTDGSSFDSVQNKRIKNII